MEQKEDIILEEDFNEKEIVPSKSSKKLKYIISIIASTLILATVSILLIGHFKFNWFKNEAYKLDVNISRNVYQSNYFSERKSVTTKVSVTKDKVVEQDYAINSKFVVFLTDKEEVPKGFLNTASLVLLDSKVTFKGEEKDLNHFNIFDHAQIKEFESNPNGSKYPMAIFKFYEDGTIEEIQLPHDMDEYHAQALIGLIEKVIPKLSRNKTEDMSLGLKINTQKEKNKIILVERHPSQQFYDFKGSSVKKLVKTEIEGDQITNIETISNLYLQSEPTKEQMIFGPEEFSYDEVSNIESVQVKQQEKENIELVKKLGKKYKLVNSKDLLKEFEEKKKEENKEEVIYEETPTVRNLGFDISASKTFNLVSFNCLGQTISIKYVVSVTKSTLINNIVITSGSGSFRFGNTGASASIKRTVSYSTAIAKITMPQYTTVSLALLAEGTLAYSVSLKSGSGTNSKYSAGLSGRLNLGSQIKTGFDSIVSLSTTNEGIVSEATGEMVLSNGSIAKGSGFGLKMGGLKVHVKGKFIGVQVTTITIPIYEGWRSL